MKAAIVELRRYALRPGGREPLIELFNRALVEPQEAVGLRVLAQFRDLDDPDSFVWLRGFRDMEARLRGLEAFYGGPVWGAHGDAANATMLDSDNVLLLRPARASFEPVPGDGLVVLAIHYLADAGDGFAEGFARRVEPALRAAGARVLAAYETEHSPNTFLRLPVREHEQSFVWLAHVDDVDADVHALAELPSGLRERQAQPAEVLRLSPIQPRRGHERL